jgi:hypothetical protein
VRCWQRCGFEWGIVLRDPCPPLGGGCRNVMLVVNLCDHTLPVCVCGSICHLPSLCVGAQPVQGEDPHQEGMLTCQHVLLVALVCAHVGVTRTDL